MAYLKKNNKPAWLKKSSKAQSGRKESTRFYQNGTWKRIRAVKIKASPLCEECQKHGLIEPATVVDHIIRIRQGGSATDMDNLQSLCSTCHNQKSGRERHQ
jgi:5-methylcytosine-specific restriction enzyme A